MGVYCYLDVPYSERLQAKDLGALWDADVKRWYSPSWSVHKNLERWSESNRTYLNVPFKQKNVAKERGAMWDSSKKSWFATPVTIGKLGEFL